MCHRSPVRHGNFAPTDAFQNLHPSLLKLVRLDIDEVGGRSPVLSDQDRLLVPLDVIEELGCLSLQSGDEFGSHEVTLKWHSLARKTGIMTQRSGG
jgi:hypothetical protein